MLKIWERREKPSAASRMWKILLVTGIVGLGVGAGLLRRRVKVGVPKSDVKIERGRAQARLQVHLSPRRKTSNGRRLLRRRIAA